MTLAVSESTDVRKAVLTVILGLSTVGNRVAAGEPFDKLPESIDQKAKELAVAFDFDKDSCYPSPAISRIGKKNYGLKTSGSIIGECRRKAQLANSNTYHRKKSITKRGVKYCVHMYALYFKKDQALDVLGGGHRHDWEFALVWTRNGKLTHASYSAHGKVTTKPSSQLHFDPNKKKTVKVVYHKDGLGTHAFRFAKKGEKAENHQKRWVTPTLVSWDTMKSEKISNKELKDRFNTFNYGKAICPFKDERFDKEIGKNPPKGYPF